jgi:xanthine dehydrogenase YagS FAD-binding subunit
MKDFELYLPRVVGDAVGLLPTEEGQRGTIRVLAGGQDLLGELKEHLVEPTALVDLKGIAELARIEPLTDGRVRIGALVRVAELEREPWIRQRFPLLAEAAASVATPQIRALGTVGGNLCQRPRCWYYRNELAVCLKKGGSECFSYGGASKYNAILGGGPSYIVHPSDLAPALVALDATVDLASPAGVRSLPLEEFFTLPADGDVRHENVLGPNEIVTHVSLPGDRDGWRSTYLKVRERDSFDFALSAVALALRLDGDAIAAARVVLGGVAPKPWRSQAAEERLVGRRIDAETCKLAAEEALAGAEPLAHNGYKIPMTKALVIRALRKLA